jgi:hypothetical protein
MDRPTVIVEALLRGVNSGQVILTLSIGGSSGWTESTSAVVSSCIGCHYTAYICCYSEDIQGWEMPGGNGYGELLVVATQKGGDYCQGYRKREGWH